MSHHRVANLGRSFFASLAVLIILLTSVESIAQAAPAGDKSKGALPFTPADVQVDRENNDDRGANDKKKGSGIKVKDAATEQAARRVIKRNDGGRGRKQVSSQLRAHTSTVQGGKSATKETTPSSKPTGVGPGSIGHTSRGHK